MKNVSKTLLTVFALGAVLFVGSISCSDDDAPEALVIQNPSNSNTIPVDETLQLGVTLESGAPVEEEVEWSSSDETIATVDRATGLVRALAIGQVRIRCIRKARRVSAVTLRRRASLALRIIELQQGTTTLER